MCIYIYTCTCMYVCMYVCMYDELTWHWNDYRPNRHSYGFHGDSNIQIPFSKKSQMGATLISHHGWYCHRIGWWENLLEPFYLMVKTMVSNPLILSMTRIFHSQCWQLIWESDEKWNRKLNRYKVVPPVDSYGF